MNPRYIFVVGSIFYLINKLPVYKAWADEAHTQEQTDMRLTSFIEIPDYIAASYEAQHCDVFGNVKGQPCRPGASYAKHFAVEGLWYLA